MNGTDNQVDLLQIKIDKARAELSPDTTAAIDAVNWKDALMAIREKKGYTFEQLGDLETETELVLCGLVTPAEYPKEVQNRLHLTKAETDELVNDMNNLVFKKIKEELIKITEARRVSSSFDVKTKVSQQTQSIPPVVNSPILKSAGIEVVNTNTAPTNSAADSSIQNESRDEILRKVENPDVHPMLAQKLSGVVQTQAIKTEHSLENITKNESKETKEAASIEKSKEDGTQSGYKVDPYRMIPE